ncbi:MAG: AzlD domain-containing protein [Gammaproteobacteria bacterium]|nr:AzlD domain-containing protein [Gammaproteobacteria bacterium]MCY4219879.1 AzlD domain-containing protein [Gammaproteobacteria bacterium]MCY4274333.1 AzlD domain-containing protein [Gammaproteobacteria bacterium]
MDTSTTLWILVIASILATYLWRFLGTLFSKRIDPDGALFQWVTCVSYCMLAGLISRMILVPVGNLIEVPLWIRLVGVMVGLAVFFIAGRIMLVAVGSGLAVFIGLTAILNI